MATVGDGESQVLTAVELFGRTVYEHLSDTEGEGNENLLISPLMLHNLISNYFVLNENSSAKESYIKVLHLLNSKVALDHHGKIQNHLYQLQLLHLDVTTFHRIKEYEDTSTLREEVYHDQNDTKPRIYDEKVAKIDSEKLILIHRSHFKSSWTPLLVVECDEKQIFKVSETEEVEVQMVSAVDTFKYKTDDHLDAKIVEIPLTGDKASIMIILPNNPDGIHDLEKELSDFDLEELTHHLDPSFISIQLPKISTEVDVFLKGSLEKMGLEDPEKPDDYVSCPYTEVGEIIQKVLFEINEFIKPDDENAEGENPGLEGEDASDRPCYPCLCQVVLDSVHVKHPFMMYVTFKTESGQPCVLFQGKIVNPLF